MKKLLFALLMVFFSFYGCKKSDNEPYHGSSPSASNNPVPASGTAGVILPVTLYWSISVDPDGDHVLYDIYIDTTSVNPKLVFSGWLYNYFQDPSLVQGKKYYWKIVSKDIYGNQTAGPVWSFTTLNVGPGSQAPETPGNPYPGSNSVNVSPSVTLSWSKCLDPQADPVTYDLYLDISPNVSTLLVQDITDTFYIPNALSVYTKYYWKVVAKDNHNNFSNGAVWNFTTGDFQYGSFTDPRDGRIYRTIVINGVTWMADNLAYTPPEASAWRYPGSDSANDAEFGKLYQNVYLSNHNIAPPGWHIANFNDYDSLFVFVGFDGGKLKEKGFKHWQDPNTGATDAVGFNARGAGNGYETGRTADFIVGEPDGIGFRFYSFSYDSQQFLTGYVSTMIPSDFYYAIRCVKN